MEFRIYWHSNMKCWCYAAVNEEAVKRIGMGGHGLSLVHDRPNFWLLEVFLDRKFGSKTFSVEDSVVIDRSGFKE